MKFQYLGTAAAEGWPAVFCNCAYCNKARALGGKNIRTRSQAILNDEVLFDFNADTYMHTLNNHLDLSKVHTLLITHSHTDHFYPAELIIRGGCYAHNMKEEKLHIYCNQAVKDYFYTAAECELEKSIEENIIFHVIKPFDTFTHRGYKVTALPAKHMKTEDCVNYLVEYEGKTLYYAHDTGMLFDSVYDYFKTQGTVLDFASLDCTCGALIAGEEGGHMGFVDNVKVVEKLKAQHTIDAHTKVIINHFSHNGGMLYDELMEKGKQYGIDVSYDGKVVEI